MSDALLTEISGKLSKILTALEKGGALAPKTGATASDPAAAKKAAEEAAKKKAADEAAKKKAADEAAKKAGAAKPGAGGPPAGTKAPGGKRTIEQVREMIRKVAADVDKQSAKDILMDDGGGVSKVVELKPEFYDKVYEACEVLLKGEGSGGAAAPAAEEEDDFA